MMDTKICKTNNEPKPSIEERWLVWQECLKGGDPNAIFQQIFTMVWDTAMFKFISECWKIKSEKNSDDPGINRFLYTFINRCYFTRASTAIRRLIDDSYGLDGSKGIYSLGSLLVDIQRYREIMTRQKYFELRTLPYETEDLVRKQNEYISNHIIDEEIGLMVPPAIDPEFSIDAHEMFDNLSGISKGNRSPFDVIQKEIFTTLQNKLTECILVGNYVDKFIAHSATPESRKAKNIDDSQITLRKVWNAQRSIYEVAQFIAGALFNSDYNPLLLLPAEAFIDWDIPLIETPEIPRLEVVYKRFRDETNEWRLEGVEEIWESVRQEMNHKFTK